MVAPKADMALARSAGGNMVLMSASICGTMAAAVAPCSTRNPTRAQAFQASPHSSEARVKAIMPMTNMRRCPNRSPRRPPVIRPLA